MSLWLFYPDLSALEAHMILEANLLLTEDTSSIDPTDHRVLQDAQVYKPHSPNMTEKTSYYKIRPLVVQIPKRSEALALTSPAPKYLPTDSEAQDEDVTPCCDHCKKLIDENPQNALLIKEKCFFESQIIEYQPGASLDWD